MKLANCAHSPQRTRQLRWGCGPRAIHAGAVQRALIVLSICIQACLLHASEGSIHFDDLNEQQVSVLLQCQATRIWTKELLSRFPANQAGGKSRIVPVTLFPLPTSSNHDDIFTSVAFKRWCKDHVKSLRSREHGIDAGLARCFGTESTDATSLLGEKLAACAESDGLGLVLRLSALGAIVNQDCQAVRDSVLTFVLACTNSREELRGFEITAYPNGTVEDSKAFQVTEVADKLLARLKEVPETAVIADYISFVLAAKEGEGAGELLAGVSRAHFVPPFLTRQGNKDRHYRFSVKRSALFGRVAEEATPLIPVSIKVSEARVLESYRSNISGDNAGKVVYTVSRFAFARFSETIVEHCISSLGKGRRRPEQLDVHLSVMASRFLQCDDVSVIIQMLIMLDRVKESELASDIGEEDRKASTVRMVKGVLTEVTAQPKEAFGISLVRLYDGLAELRKRADAWERALLESLGDRR